jgi:hypothetical protein
MRNINTDRHAYKYEQTVHRRGDRDLVWKIRDQSDVKNSVFCRMVFYIEGLLWSEGATERKENYAGSENHSPHKLRKRSHCYRVPLSSSTAKRKN